MNRSKRVYGTSGGFTLLELLVAAVISFVLGAGGFLFFRSQLRSLTDQSASLDAIEGARAALDFMASEIRMAGAAPGAACANCGLGSAGSSGLTVSWNTDGGTTPTQWSRYYVSGTQLMRCTGSSNCNGGSALIKNLSSLSLAYYQDSPTYGTSATMAGGVVASPSSVTRVVVTVQVSTARATTVTTVSLFSSVSIRNQSAIRGYMGAS